ncbi:MAG: glycerophosphodiester phosphodiesterase family protein [Candidatus Izemoplasmatales bacterium]
MKKIIALLSIALTALAFLACDGTTTLTTLLTTTGLPTTGSTTTGATTTLPTTGSDTTTEVTTVPVVDDRITLKDGKNYIMTDTGVAVDLSGYLYKGTFGEVGLDEGAFSDLPDSVTVAGGTLTATEKGMFDLSFTVGDTTVSIMLFTKLAEEDAYVVFQDSYGDLPDGALPEGYVIQTGTAAISGGKLRLDGVTTTPTRVLLPDYLKMFKNYVIETDFSILSAKEPTRWASVMYRYGAEGYFQMCVRQNATATNGVEFAKWINNGWNVPKTVAFTEMIDAAETYRLRIELNGDVVNEYIDGALQLTYENASEFKNGNIGMQASGAVAVYDNVIVTIPEDYVDTSSVEFTTIAELYEPETGIQLPPTAMKFAASAQDILSIATEEVRPQALILTIDNMMNVVTPGGLRIMSILEALLAIDGRVIPAFYVRNRDVAVSLAGLLKDYGIRDVFMISRNTTAITDARTAYSMLRCILEIDYDSAVPTLDDAALLAIRDEVNTVGAIGALLPEEYVSRDNADYLQRRLVSVYANTYGADEESVARSVLSGVNGVIVEDVESLYGFYGTFPENSLIRTPLVIGHRGMSTRAPENTVEGSMLAYEAGADVIELDIYLTTDNRLVVMHDGTTARTTNGTLTVEESTLEQLKALTILDTTGNFPNLKIPTLDEYFETFGDLDVQIFIEIKSTKLEIVPVLATLIDTYGVSDQVTVIAFSTAQVENMRTNLPNISVGYLNSGFANASNLEGSLLVIMNSVVPIKTTFNPSYSGLTEALIEQLHYRGITTWPWTVNDAEVQYEYYSMGVGGITTDYTWRLTNDWLRMEMNDSRFTVDLANPVAQLQLRGVIGTPGGLSYNYVPRFLLIDDGGTGIAIANNAVVTGFSHVGSALVAVWFESTFADGTPYRIFDDLVVIDVVDSRLSATAPSPWVGALAVAVLPPAAIFARRKEQSSKGCKETRE